MKLRILAVSSKKRKSSQKLKKTEKTEKTEIKTEKQITEKHYSRIIGHSSPTVTHVLIMNILFQLCNADAL